MRNIPLYHITPIQNLAGIFREGNVYCKNKLRQMKLTVSSIAYEGLQDRRGTFAVPIEPYGVLHDYVPFFFAPRPPMLYAIHRGWVESYCGTQDEIVHIEIKLNDVLENQLRFVYTDGHAIMFYSDYYNDPAKIDEAIDWEVMEALYWHDTPEDNDRKRRRQAEFLIQEEVPCRLIRGMYTMNKGIRTQVSGIVEQHGYDIHTETKREWYY